MEDFFIYTWMTREEERLQGGIVRQYKMASQIIGATFSMISMPNRHPEVSLIDT